MHVCRMHTGFNAWLLRKEQSIGSPYTTSNPSIPCSNRAESITHSFYPFADAVYFIVYLFIHFRSSTVIDWETLHIRVIFTVKQYINILLSKGQKRWSMCSAILWNLDTSRFFRTVSGEWAFCVVSRRRGFDFVLLCRCHRGDLHLLVALVCFCYWLRTWADLAWAGVGPGTD